MPIPFLLRSPRFLFRKRDAEGGSNTHIQPRKPLVAESRYSIAKQRQSQEDEEHLPSFARKDADAGLLFEHVDAGDEKQRAAKVDRQGDGDVADDKEPTGDPRRNAPPLGGCQHEGLIVYAWRMVNFSTRAFNNVRIGRRKSWLPPAVG